MTSVVLQPNRHGRPGGVVSREKIISSLPPSEAAEVPSCKAPAGFVVYGKDGASSHDGPGWRRLAPGDPVLFYHDRHYFAVGRVAHKLVSRRLARALWPRDEVVYDHFILIDDVKEISLPARRFHRAVGYKLSHVIRGFTVLDADRSRRALPVLKQLRPIRPKMSVQEKAAGELDFDEDEVIEGRQLLVRHLVRERNRGLVRRKKEDVLRRTGTLACEACQFDFRRTYGWLDLPWCEVHHNQPLGESNGTLWAPAQLLRRG